MTPDGVRSSSARPSHAPATSVTNNAAASHARCRRAAGVIDGIAANPALSAAGMTPTLLAAAATTYAGLPVASDYDAVAILSGQSYALDMPLPGQQSIVDASRAGQGVVLNEWAAFQVSTGHWRVLRELQLLARASGTTARLTFSLESPGHPIWDGVPASFSTVGPMGANIGNVLLNGGVRVASCPQCGGAGVVVKDSAGRTVQFASAPNYIGINTWLTEPNITRLMTNAVRWAGRCQ